MPHSQHYEGQLERGRQFLAEQFEAWGLTDARERAEYLERRMRTELDWGPQRTSADEPVPPLRPARAAAPDVQAEYLAEIRATLAKPTGTRTVIGDSP